MSSATKLLLRSLVAVVLGVSAAACGRYAKGSGQPPATIVFINESIDQATVYVVAPGVEFRRVGTVIPGRTETLTIPADMIARAGTLNIVARLLARPEVPQTGPVTMRAGERYEVRLSANARIMSFLPAGS